MAPTALGLGRAAAVLLLVLVAAGCSATRGAMVPASRAIGAGIDDLDPASLAVAARRTALALDARPPSSGIVVGGHRFSAQELAASARRVAAIADGAADAAALTRAVASRCVAYRMPEPAKVTAYYEPVLTARRTRNERFRYAIYSPPSAPQLAAVGLRLGRVPTRADIDRGQALRGLGLELAWVDDAVARFFLQVQGSGRLVFDDGSEMRVGYAATNGLAYRSIGAAMLAGGILKPGRASAPAMRAWLAAHPERREAILEGNPRYVFFRERKGEGPVGSLGAPLVAGRSIAIDEGFVPQGVLAWLGTTKPVVGGDGSVVSRTPLTRFVFAGDTGAAIQGKARVDLYVGSGEEAGDEAGVMNESGELDLMVCTGSPAAATFSRPTLHEMPMRVRLAPPR